MSLYDSIAELYDPWSVSVTEDVGFYVEEAERAGSPVVELAVGTGRIAVPTAAAGVRVIGIDSSPGMLDVCRRRGELAGVSELLDLRLGELEAPPVEERVALVTCPFRSFLHLLDDGARLRALGAARELLLPGGRLVFDVFAPSASDIADTHGRWLEREPGIFERADWDSQARTLDAVGAGRERRDELRARVALEPRVARAARAGGLPGPRLLRLVRPPPVRRRRRHGLGGAAAAP